MHDFEFQRFVDSSLPLSTQEGIAAKRARTHGEWCCSVACIQDKIGVSVSDVVVSIIMFPWRHGVESGEKGLSVVQFKQTGN